MVEEGIFESLIEGLREKKRVAVSKGTPVGMLVNVLDEFGVNRLSSFSQSAVTMALLDLVSRSNEKTLRNFLGLPSANEDFEIITSFTIAERNVEGIVGSIEKFYREGVGEGGKSSYRSLKRPLIKIKLGFPDDVEILTEALARLKTRFSVDKIFRFSLDVNQGWSDCDLVEKFLGLSDLVERGFNIEFVEEPVDWTMGTRWVRLEEFFRNEWFKNKSCRNKRLLPVFLDESIRTLEEIKGLVDRGKTEKLNITTNVIRGIVVKLGKIGGPVNALKAVRLAKSGGFRVMMGCFIESNIGISAAMQVAGECDYIDLDAPFLIRDNPVKGVETSFVWGHVEGIASTWGVLRLHREPGLGVRLC